MDEDRPILLLPSDELAAQYVRNYMRRFSKATYIDLMTYMEREMDWALELDAVHREVVRALSRREC